MDASPIHPSDSRGDWLPERLRRYRIFLLVVILPTLLVALYFGLIASNQYESETHFIVRRNSDSGGEIGGLSLMLGKVGGVGSAQPEAMSVGDYLSSHDAVAALRRNNDLIGIFRRPGVDAISRLWSDQPTSEWLLRYYRRHVDVRLNSDTGITTLRVRTFQPADSLAISRALLKLGEDRVNALNDRVYTDTLTVAKRQLDDAERGVSAAQTRITGYRQQGRDIDPAHTGEAQTTLVSHLRQELAEARAKQASLAVTIAPNSPQRLAIDQQVRSLAQQVAAEDARLAGGGSGTIAAGLGGYESLKLRQDFAAKRYEVAAAALEHAREQAQRQQLFVVRIVEPNLPEKSLYPQRLNIIGTVFVGLTLLYSIGWLIAAGVREHAA